MRGQQYVKMTLMDLVLNLAFFSKKSPFLSAYFSSLYLLPSPPPSSACTDPVRWRGHPQKILFHYPWCFAVRTERGHSLDRDVPGLTQS